MGISFYPLSRSSPPPLFGWFVWVQWDSYFGAYIIPNSHPAPKAGKQKSHFSRLKVYMYHGSMLDVGRPTLHRKFFFLFPLLWLWGFYFFDWVICFVCFWIIYRYISLFVYRFVFLFRFVFFVFGGGGGSPLPPFPLHFPSFPRRRTNPRTEKGKWKEGRKGEKKNPLFVSGFLANPFFFLFVSFFGHPELGKLYN